MEQYQLPPDKYYDMLVWAIQNYPVEDLYIRNKGSSGGEVIVSANMKGKILSVKRSQRGVRIFIDKEEVFKYFFPRSRDPRDGWALAYYREYNDGRIHIAVTGYPNLQEPYSGPDDPALPEVKRTIFRSAANGKQLIEITFTGKIPIRRTNRLAFPPCKDFHFWEIDRRHKR